jgi:hypothetical protein
VAEPDTSKRTYVAGESFEELFAEEKLFVAGNQPEEELRGLALSGGGIRSASFPRYPRRRPR